MEMDIMKKILSLLLVIALCVSVCASVMAADNYVPSIVHVVSTQ